MTKVSIYGNGMIGKRLHEDLGYEIRDHRVSTIDSLVSDIEAHNPDVIVNAIGFTGKNNVDECEDNTDKTLMSNTYVPLVMAEAARRTDKHLVHFSTGCMFDTFMVVNEDTEPNFDGLFYSRTKVYSDKAMEWLAKQGQPVTNIRFRVPIDDRPNPRGLIDKLIKYGKVIDGWQSVTYIPELVGATQHLIDNKLFGTYNVVTNGPINYPQLLGECRKYDESIHYDVIKPEELDLVRTKVDMSSYKLNQSGFYTMSGRELMEKAPEDYFKNRGK